MQRAIPKLFTKRLASSSSTRWWRRRRPVEAGKDKKEPEMTGSPQGPANWRRIVEDLQVVDRFLDTLKNSGQHPADENLECGIYDCYVPRNLLRRAAAVDRLNVAAVSEVCRDLLQPLPS
jgi:hypothetical protein